MSGHILRARAGDRLPWPVVNVRGRDADGSILVAPCSQAGALDRGGHLAALDPADSFELRALLDVRRRSGLA